MRRLSAAGRTLAALLIVACAGPDTGPTAGPPELIPRSVLFGNPEKAGPSISPDGKLIAYIAPDSGVQNIWVRTIGSNDDRPITNDRKRGIRNCYWQADSKKILFLQDDGGDENWHIYQTDVATRETRNLTPFPNVQAQIVALDINHPNELLVAINNRDPQLHDVHRIDLTTGTTRLDTRNPGDVAEFSADNDLVVRAAHVMLPDGGTELRIRDNAGAPWRTLMKWGADESFGGIAAFNDDNTKAWLVSSVDANAAQLIEVDLVSGSSTVVASDPIYDVSGLQIHPVTRKLEAVVFVRERRAWHIVDPAVAADFEALGKAQDADFFIVSRSRDDARWVVMYVGDDAPVRYHVYDRTTKQIQLLFTTRPALENYTLARTQPVSFKARDGMTIYGYLTLPVGVDPKSLPTIVNVHGGPWARDTWGYSDEVQWMANRGYAVLQVNFRGSTGYGKQYLNAGDREWGGKMHTDLLDGKAWAVQQGYTDSTKVAIYGGSYGGYAALVGLAFTPDEFAAGVDIVGPSNLNTLLSSIPPYWAPMRSILTKRMGDNEEFLSARSPLFKADQIRKPLFIAQGANDPRVKQAESDQIVAAMRKASLPVEYVVYTDEGHGFARPENNLHFYGLAEAFLGKHLGGRVEPATAVPGTSGVVK